MGETSRADAEGPSVELGLALIEQGILDGPALARAETLSRSASIPLFQSVLQIGLAEEPTVLRTLADVMALPYVEEASRLELDRDSASKLGLPYLRRNGVAPIADSDLGVSILIADPGNVPLIRELAFQLESSVKLSAAPTATVHKLLDSLEHEHVAIDALPEEQAAKDKRAFDDAQIDGPVIAFVSQVMNDAVARGASDLHFASAEAGLDLRLRINGSLIRQKVTAPVNPSAVFARLKVISGMNVAERRKPQDGRLSSVIGGRVVDFRVSSLPTQLGESVVVRVLDPKSLRLGWAQLGFEAETEKAIRETIEIPTGLFLVTGPTGSGKTTTLYTALNHLRSERRKIISIEDPVEYQLNGIDQVQVDEVRGFGFADALRTVLRQDPNIIMVGEIRDSETAEIACRAALVGRLVLSTLHTNSAHGALTRMLDLGVEEFVLRDILRGVLGQQLVTTHCSTCGGKGCGDCAGAGNTGRRLIAELVRPPF